MSSNERAKQLAYMLGRSSATHNWEQMPVLRLPKPMTLWPMASEASGVESDKGPAFDFIEFKRRKMTWCLPDGRLAPAYIIVSEGMIVEAACRMPDGGDVVMLTSEIGKPEPILI